MTPTTRDQVLTLVREKLAEDRSEEEGLGKEALALPFSSAAKMKKALKPAKKEGMGLGTKALLGVGLVGAGAVGVGAMQGGKQIAKSRYAPPQSYPPGY